jgi:hypothetical protein
MIKGTMVQFGEKRQANVTFTNGKKKLSLCVDNGPMPQSEVLHRADIRCFSNGSDVTGKVFGVFDDDTILGDVENMSKAMNWLQLSSDPYAVP